MAKRFTDQVGIQPQSMSTGFVQGSNTLLNRLQSFKQSTDRLVDVVEAKRGKEEAQAVKLEKEGGITQAPTKKEAGVFETILTGGVSAKSYNKTLETAYLASLGNDTKEAIANIEAQNPDNSAQFNEKAQGYINGVLQGVDPAVQQQVAQFAESQLSNARIRVNRKNILKNKAEAIALSSEAITSFSNESATLAREGNQSGSAEAIMQSFSIIDGMVEAGDLPVDKATNLKREIEREASEQVNRKKFDDIIETEGAEAANAELNKVRTKSPSGWTPDEWKTYTDSQQTDINRQLSKKRAAAQKVSNEAKVALNQYKTAVSLGFEVDPNEKLRVKGLVSGTALQDEYQRINKTSAFSVLPADARAVQLEEAETGELKDVADFASMLQANNEINKMATKDGYSLGVNQGLINEITFNPSDPLTLTMKADQAEQLSDHYSVPVSPLSDGEANGLAANIDNMTVQEKVQLATVLNEAPAVWGQISPKNQQAFSMAGATGDQVLMSTVFSGQELLKEKLVTPVKVSEYLPVSDDFLGDVYGTQDKSAILEAAKAHYAATIGNAEVFDEDGWETSLSAVTGGIGEVNGNKIELPRGVDEDRFEDFIDSYSSIQLNKIGTVAGFTEPQALEIIQNGKIKSIGSNKYIVMSGEAQALFTTDGEPLVIEYSEEAVAEQEAIKFTKSKKISTTLDRVRSF